MSKCTSISWMAYANPPKLSYYRLHNNIMYGSDWNDVVYIAEDLGKFTLILHYILALLVISSLFYSSNKNLLFYCKTMIQTKYLLATNIHPKLLVNLGWSQTKQNYIKEGAKTKTFIEMIREKFFFFVCTFRTHSH